MSEKTVNYKMRVNVENMVRQATRCMSGNYADMYRYSLTELIKHLKEVKKHHEAGESKEVLDAFFAFYVFDENQGG